MFSATIVQWLEANMLSCPVKATTGYDCPGCGLQRSIVSLLEGDILNSISFYPPLLPMIWMVVTLLIALNTRIPYRYVLLYVSYGIVVFTMIINFILKIN